MPSFRPVGGHCGTAGIATARITSSTTYRCQAELLKLGCAVLGCPNRLLRPRRRGDAGSPGASRRGSGSRRPGGGRPAARWARFDLNQLSRAKECGEARPERGRWCRVCRAPTVGAGPRARHSASASRSGRPGLRRRASRCSPTTVGPSCDSSGCDRSLRPSRTSVSIKSGVLQTRQRIAAMRVNG